MLRKSLVVCLMSLGLASALALPALAQDATPEATPEMTMEAPANAILSGLNDPRGVSYDADGNLYVAEAGGAGETLVTHDPDSGDLYAGLTSKITELAADGTQSAPVPYLISSGALGGEIVGATDMIATDSSLWVAIASQLPGNPFSDSVVEIDKATGTVKTFINLYINEQTNNPDGGDIDSNVNAIQMGPDGSLYIVDTGANTIYTWTSNDGLQVFQTWQDDPVPTALAFAPDGTYYVGFLGQGLGVGAGKVEHWSADGQSLIETFGNLTTVTDVAVGSDGNVYAVELVTQMGDQGPVPSSGDVVMLSSDGATPIAPNLPQPYSLAQAPDGSWAVSVGTVFGPPDSGAVIKIGGDM